jgi:hypothetical protein
VAVISDRLRQSMPSKESEHRITAIVFQSPRAPATGVISIHAVSRLLVHVNLEAGSSAAAMCRFAEDTETQPFVHGRSQMRNNAAPCSSNRETL